MQSFRFRLEKVLGWYGKQCRIEEDRLAALVAAWNEMREALVRLEAERLGIGREIVSRTTIPSRELMELSLYRVGAKKKELEWNAELKRREGAVAEQRNRVIAVRRRRVLLEKLRERHLAEYTAELDRELEALVSDSYMAQWPRATTRVRAS